MNEIDRECFNVVRAFLKKHNLFQFILTCERSITFNLQNKHSGVFSYVILNRRMPASSDIVLYGFNKGVLGSGEERESGAIMSGNNHILNLITDHTITQLRD